MGYRRRRGPCTMVRKGVAEVTLGVVTGRLGTFYYQREFDLMDQLARASSKRRGRQAVRRVAEFRPRFIVR